MNSPVSATNVTPDSDRVMLMGGLPPAASSVAMRSQTRGGCGDRTVRRWTAGSMGGSLHEHTFVCDGKSRCPPPIVATRAEACDPRRVHRLLILVALIV